MGDEDEDEDGDETVTATAIGNVELAATGAASTGTTVAWLAGDTSP